MQEYKPYSIMLNDYNIRGLSVEMEDENNINVAFPMINELDPL